LPVVETLPPPIAVLLQWMIATLTAFSLPGLAQAQAQQGAKVNLSGAYRCEPQPSHGKSEKLKLPKYQTRARLNKPHGQLEKPAFRTKKEPGIRSRFFFALTAHCALKRLLSRRSQGRRRYASPLQSHSPHRARRYAPIAGQGLSSRQLWSSGVQKASGSTGGGDHAV
jgi:hypothetical protein